MRKKFKVPFNRYYQDMSDNKEILMSANAIAKCLTIDSMDHTKESAGVLIGYIDKDTDTLIITDMDTGKQKQTATYVVIDDEALVQIVKDLQDRERKEYIVGWWHTHPGYGTFLSGTDKGTQRTYQNLFPEAVAMVIDPSKYYGSKNQKDLDISFFRLINDFDYKPVPFGIYYDDHTRHLSNLVSVELKWKIPQLAPDEVRKLHLRLDSLHSSTLLDEDKRILHGFVDILSATVGKEIDSKEEKELLNSVDYKLSGIAEDIDRIYDNETSNIYAILNIIAVVVFVISWFLIARFS